MRMLLRHFLFAGIAVASVLSAGPSAADVPKREWAFRVLLEDAPVGRQVFRLFEEGDRATMRIEANLDVKVLFFTAYSYRHQNEEIWQGGCLASIASKTDDNGDPFEVRGRRAEQSFVVETLGASEKLDGCVRSFAYWDLERLRSGDLLNSQTGRIEKVTLKQVAEETVRSRGVEVAATRWLLESPEFRIDLWYSKDRDWLALETLRGGRRLRYERE